MGRYMKSCLHANGMKHGKKVFEDCYCKPSYFSLFLSFSLISSSVLICLGPCFLK
jgi:hypothetical protein